MALPTASDNVFPKVIMAEGAAPSTPSANQVKLYAKADGLLYSKDDAGTETLVSGGVGGLSDHNHTGGGDGGDLDSPVIDGLAIFNEESAPSTPAAATVAVYAKADGLMYSKDDAGTETLMSGGAGGGISITTVVQELAADHTVASDSTFHDVTGMTGISVAAGTWIALVDVELATGSSVGPAFRLTDGTTTYAQGNHTLLSPPTTLSNHFVMHMKPTVLGSTTTFKLQVWSDVGCTIKKYPIRGSDSGIIATHITFLKIA